nr:Stp1/IreP family PP2C-type Ser/Thr phosphatase [Chloroflexota bacterium]
MTVLPEGFGAASDQGRVRDHNEDGYLVRPPLFAVADGMGGHAAGEVASRLALESLASKTTETWRDGRDVLLRALSEANRVVYRQAKSRAGARGMGTTCVLILLDGDRVHIGHVGDSRAYRLRAGTLEPLTRDHTVVGDMVEQGLLTPQQALADGNRGFLTRALGAAARVDAEVDSFDIQAGDRFLLCSDGLSGMLPDPVIEQIMRETPDAQAAADRLIAAANEAGGEDNVTALVVHPPPGEGGGVAVPGSAGTERRGATRIAVALLAAALV